MRQELIDFYEWVWKDNYINDPMETSELVDMYLKSINSDAPSESRNVATHEAKKEFHQNTCHSCGEAMSNDCERCSRLWSS